MAEFFKTTDANRQAAIIRSTLKQIDTTLFNQLLTDLSLQVDVINQPDITAVTTSRLNYQLNKSVRKRNAMYAELVPFQDKFKSSSVPLSLFTVDTNQEIIALLGDVQSPISNMEDLYRSKKYETNEIASTISLLTRVRSSSAAVEDNIDKFKEAFLI